MDKKINLGFWVLVIVLVVGILAAAAYHRSSQKNLGIGDKIAPTVPNAKKLTDQKGLGEKDVVLVSKNDGNYEVNLATKESKLFSDMDVNLATFSGIPKGSENVVNSISLFSGDKKQALAISITSDLTKEPDDNGSYPTVSGKSFVCNLTAKSCSENDIFATAYKATDLKGNWFDNNPGVVWDKWDSAKNILYGYTVGADGNVAPIYVFNANNKTIKKTAISASFEVPNGAFSSSAAKLVMIDTSVNNKWSLALYDSSNLTSPLKKIDISKIIDLDNDSNMIGSVSWSVDEKTLALATDNQIYTVNLDSGDVVLRYTDTSNVAAVVDEGEESGIDSSAIKFSADGKYVAFVDYDRGNLPYDENKSYTVLKTIDLTAGNKVAEVLREEDISLDVQ